MNNNRRRNFRIRPQKNNFRRRGGSTNTSSSISFNNGNRSFRNGPSNNIHSVEKAMQKFQQMAKDAQSSGDPVLAENYLQHADHYLRRFNELSDKINGQTNYKTEDSQSSQKQNADDKEQIQASS
tara:strand:+ start:532 stop:906 length:375 start_codon:yes stop_codon:yes gene_type:complete